MSMELPPKPKPFRRTALHKRFAINTTKFTSKSMRISISILTTLEGHQLQSIRRLFKRSLWTAIIMDILRSRLLTNYSVTNAIDFWLIDLSKEFVLIASQTRQQAISVMIVRRPSSPLS